MRHVLFERYSVPLVALGGLVAMACLGSTWYINRLQADLAQTVRRDAAGMEAAVELQVQLRHLRVHCLGLVADPSPERRAVVDSDLERIDAAITVVRAMATAPEDTKLATEITTDYQRYRSNLKLNSLPSPGEKPQGIAGWSDAHHMSEVLVSCRELADNQRQRMNDNLERSQQQTTWVGCILLMLGFGGVLAGLLSGSATAREVNRRLLRAEQLAAVGQLAAGVAHEVRNPLTGVKLLLQAAVRAVNPTALNSERLHLLLQEIARIERTVQGLLDFARTTSLVRKRQDLRAVIETAIGLTQSRAEARSISIQTESSQEPLLANVNHDQLLSLLTNLLANAVEATPPGGQVGVHTELDSTGTIRVDVWDTGSGINPAVSDQLFGPFVTTKSTGTGLGLNVARRVAHDHGGTLTVANRSTNGTCFTLRLPAAETSHAKAADR